MAMADDDDTLHNNLTQWITQNGGSVHRNLALHTPNSHEICNDGVNDTITMKTQPYKFSHRGIFAKHGPISKGEVLIRLPCQLALDGSHLPKNYDTSACQNSDAPLSTACGNISKAQQQRNASAWLRCLASLMNAWHRKNRCTEDNLGNGKDNSLKQYETSPSTSSVSKTFNCYDPYLASLPKEYDSLLNWSEGEIKYFLSETTLGMTVLLQDTKCTANSAVSNSDTNSSTIVEEGGHERALHERFVKTVVPYLTFLRNNGLILEEGGGRQFCDPKQPKRQKIETTSTVESNSSEISDQLEYLFPLFREGCMCISTRAFHMQFPTNSSDNSTTDTNSDNSYRGPYLLPYIDLLNHAPRCSSKHVTTLSRDTDGSFVMLAERDIAIDEEICHSYDSGGVANNQESTQESDGLNSAQLLQTFGFVDLQDASKRLLEYYPKQNNNKDGDQYSHSLDNITPAVLTKKAISIACKQLAKSSFPSTLRRFMDESGMLDEGWECWEMPALEEESSCRWNLLSSYSDEFLITFGGSISDELITICCLHLLPEDAINDLLDESKKEGGSCESRQQSLLLGQEVLNDFYLGKLVLQAMNNAIKEKMNAYKVSSSDLLANCKQHEQVPRFLECLRGLYCSESQSESPFCWGESCEKDLSVLSKMTPHEEEYSTDLMQKFKYGMVISLEERTCLLEMKKKVLDMTVELDGEREQSNDM